MKRDTRITRRAGSFDDPDFAGILVQHFHCTGDERQPIDSPTFISRSDLTPDYLALLMRKAEESDELSVRCLFSW